MTAQKRRCQPSSLLSISFASNGSAPEANSSNFVNRRFSTSDSLG